jgi:hypothetical protein
VADVQRGIRAGDDAEPLMPTIRVAPDEILTITAPAGAWGNVTRHGTNQNWHVGDTSPLKLGPGLYFVDDHLTCNATSQAVAALETTLPRATEIIRSERIIRMALGDKFKNLAERARSVPAKLSERADAAFARLDKVEARGDQAFTGFETMLTDVESGVAAAEDALNQLTNGAPAE